ncbi:helix-turn-helix domain-containing protein [Bacteroides sp. UBA939]|uniref:helix-turn-helix domain-containing protein n=1 Tax=Bacteroides sp. UBA939 TaxID=1946092 RepID=UPI0025C64379|nr:helix-turn-helix transcriptional regulator [Bacteroides sp. UBA939]
MKKPISRYTFYKNKYGSELLIDVVELKYIKKFLAESPVHTLTYYDITFITEGEGYFSINNHDYAATPHDVFFSRPGEIRQWDVHHIVNGYALIFEEEFLSSFFKDTLFIQHLPFFNRNNTASGLHLPDELYKRMLQLLHDIKAEIDTYKQNDVHVLRALLYEVLMLLNRAYRQQISIKDKNKEASNTHLGNFLELAGTDLREHHSVQYYADKLCITPNYLNEIVSSAMNISAKQYIRNKVMDEAKSLLVYTDLPVSEIAFELHFSTVSYFVRSFRQLTGESPLAYRKAHRP